MSATVKKVNKEGVDLVVTTWPYPSYRAATVAPVTDTNREVTVYGWNDAFGGMRPPRVNWSACGSQPAEQAFAYAMAIAHASELAAELPEPFEPLAGVEVWHATEDGSNRGVVVEADEDEDGNPITADQVAVEFENGQGVWGTDPKYLRRAK